MPAGTPARRGGKVRRRLDVPVIVDAIVAVD
jgi:hypothetical protein